MLFRSYSLGNDITIIDIGGSYRSMISLHRGKYFDSTNQKQGVFLWNELQTSMTDDALAEKLVHHYSADGEAANETQDEIQNQTQDKIQNQMQDQIQDQIRQDVKQFVQELLSLGILRECLRPCCAEDADDVTCVYPTKEPFVGCLEIAGMRIALYGSRELISSQLDAFLKDCRSEERPCRERV